MSKTLRITRILSAALVVLLLFGVFSAPASAADRNGLVVEKLCFRDVLRLYIADRGSFGPDALETDQYGVSNAAKRLAELFAFTVGLNYTGEGLNCNYFGKDVTAKMGEEPYADSNLLATYAVEILPYRSYAKALADGKKTELRVYLTGYVNAASGVEQVLHYLWSENGSWYAVKDDNPFYKVSYNGQNAQLAQQRGAVVVRSRSGGGGTASLEAWKSLADAGDGDGVVHLNGCTLVAGQGAANLFGVTEDVQALTQTGGLSSSLLAVSDFVRGDTTYQTGPLVFARDCYEDDTMRRVPDGEALRPGVTYRFRVVYDEALCVSPGSDRGDVSLSVRSEVTGVDQPVTDMVWYGDEAYFTSDKYNPHAVEFTFTPSREGNGVCTFRLHELVGSDSSLKTAAFHTRTLTGGTAAPASAAEGVPPADAATVPPPATEVPATEVPATEVPATEVPATETPVQTPAETPAQTPVYAPPVQAAPPADTPTPATPPINMNQATSLPLLTAEGGSAPVTRGMLAESLWMLSGRPAAEGGLPFSDLPPTGSSRSQAVRWAAATGLIVGYGNNTFGPDQPVTREQTAVILQRYAAQKGMTVGADGNLSAWSDADRVSTWARDAVLWALNTGVMTARGSAIVPGENALSGDVASMIFRLQQRL